MILRGNQCLAERFWHYKTFSENVTIVFIGFFEKNGKSLFLIRIRLSWARSADFWCRGFGALEWIGGTLKAEISSATGIPVALSEKLSKLRL